MRQYKTADEVRKAVGQIKRDAGRLQDKIHAVGVSVLSLWKTKKVSPEDAAEMLTDLMGASTYHADAFSKWVGMFTPLLWDKENSRWAAGEKDNQRIVMTESFKAAREKPFWECKPPSTPKPFDELDAIERIIDKAEKKQKGEGKVHEDDFVDAEVTRLLREAAAVARQKKAERNLSKQAA